MNAPVGEIAECLWAVAGGAFMHTGTRRMDAAAEHSHPILLALVRF
jgi:hypothetical protein